MEKGVLVVATGNAHKAREIETILGRVGSHVRTLREIGFQGAILEEGATFEENARIKCQEIVRFLKKFPGVWVLADDSGLEVEALQGRPGVYSARYAGEPADDRANISKLLHEMRDVPWGKRAARFCCALVVGKTGSHGIVSRVFDGFCSGKIGIHPQGENGFGYDPIFFPKGFRRTFAELKDTEKNEISHRAKALRKFRKWWLSRER